MLVGHSVSLWQARMRLQPMRGSPLKPREQRQSGVWFTVVQSAWGPHAPELDEAAHTSEQMLFTQDLDDGQSVFSTHSNSTHCTLKFFFLNQHKSSKHIPHTC